MEEQIMVFSKEWFKKHNKTLCWFANAPIIKYWFRWLLRIHKDIPWNEKIEEIMPNAFTYGKKLVLVDYVKLKNGEEVFNCSKKLHRKLKNKGLLVKRLRYQQTTDFRTHEKFGKRLYYGLKPFWYLLHFWDWSTSVQPVLNVGFDTLTVYPDAGTGNTTVDGDVRRVVTSETFSTIRSSAGTNAYETLPSIPIILLASSTTDKFDRLTRGILTLDTSSLTSNATISSAVFGLYYNEKQSGLGSTDLHIVSSTPTANNALQNSDYGQLGSTTFGNITYANFTPAQYNNITLNTSGKSNISLTSISKFGAVLSWDINNSFTGTWVSNRLSGIYFYAADQTGTANDPKLVVTYTLPVTFIPRTMWF